MVKGYPSDNLTMAAPMALKLDLEVEPGQKIVPINFRGHWAKGQGHSDLE